MPLPNIHEMAGDRGRRRHRGRNKMRAAPKTLAALEIAVRGRGAALAGREAVRVHGKAHGAAWLTPLKTRGKKDRIKPLGFGLLFDKPRARHDHRAHARS